MAQIAKMELQMELKSSAERFYGIFRSKRYLIPEMCPDLVKNVKVIKGDWESVGSIKEWTLVTGGCERMREIVEAIDDEKKSITFTTLEGDITKDYNDTKAILEVSGSSRPGCSIKWTVPYEKKNRDLPDPSKYIDFVQLISQKIDAYLSKTA
ncbi:hypothetical protein F8388_005370 [Cannabis sativa]|uniref:Bet v I/Major latex protein domain-containing protein n=1 Tax=Cannabis sativa TaxID=3483 RepID=A0A7J6E2P2_CANSA|nr:hypothetical protein F8388_005370 [Cannabis sativa]KAF4400625.1 hypothetical protein G4B88_023033 [Cannabis sativa]